ncbi:MAG: hypothetical protein QOH58_3290 [Thermoleophilaceae bacterium]|jgi:hypothetical protein|nr:hypothetical protein [Thermoleophilaceae bacterium]
MNRLGHLTALIAIVLLAFGGSASALPLLGGGDDKPSVSTSPAESVTSSSALLKGSVDPNGRGTDYVFEYGPTAAYGAKTSSTSVGGGDSAKNVAKTITGLQPGTTYHFRISATNSKGTTRSSDRSFTTLPPPPPGTPDPDPAPDPEPDPDPDPGTDPGSDEQSDPDSGGDDSEDSRGLISGEEEAETADEPELGSSVVVAPGEGTLLVRRPGRSTFVALAFGSELPVGTEVDARDGTLALTSALPSGKTQTGRFGGGRFVIRQGSRGYVDLHLRGDACPRPVARSKHAKSSVVASAARKPRSGRRLWGKDDGGRFRTHGKNSHATVRGTRWLVEDRCDGTLTRVTNGAVVVRDTVRHKRVVLKAGEHYLARPHR